MTHQKRLSAPRHYPVDRKEMTYTTTMEGSRSKEEGIPVVVLLRDLLGYADTKKEAKEIVRKGKVRRNGNVVSDIRDGIGVMDAVEVGDQTFRVLPGEEELKLVETDDARRAARIESKRKNGDQFVYGLRGGENKASEEEYSTGSSLIGGEEFPLENGVEALVLGGKHAGELVEVQELHENGMKDNTATVENGRTFEIGQDKLFPVGDLEVK